RRAPSRRDPDPAWSWPSFAPSGGSPHDCTRNLTGGIGMGLLDGRVAVVTGAGRGIGRGIALELAKEGAKVVVNDAGVETDGRGGSEDPAALVVKEIEQLGGEGAPNYDDVSKFDAARNIVQTAIDSFGTIDILVNNAGILRDRSLLKM